MVSFSFRDGTPGGPRLIRRARRAALALLAGLSPSRWRLLSSARVVRQLEGVVKTSRAACCRRHRDPAQRGHRSNEISTTAPDGRYRFLALGAGRISPLR